MTRSKKSRNPGVGSSGAPKPKLDKASLAKLPDRKPKKKNGKIAGNRQQEAEKKSNAQRQNTQAKDPRLGSKKPIVLTKAEVPAAKTTKKPAKIKPIAAVRTVEPSVDLERRLHEIEQDEKLLAIIEKQDEDIALSEEEIEHFNLLMDEHASLQEALGIEEDEKTHEQHQPSSEEDLWNKLDRSDFSNFEFNEDE
ncbi:Der GTPase-activating protein YihI [Thalassotalea atypica]|uniref:Der GTPase-activating protein YihI n=1 Tax=Thalassotalea atypica TaxID=2054316 RepID=UPI00257474CF|nr:Der GTPase-activating protein YihI [Thalassotalea atypica]